MRRLTAVAATVGLAVGGLTVPGAATAAPQQHGGGAHPPAPIAWGPCARRSDVRCDPVPQPDPTATAPGARSRGAGPTESADGLSTRADLQRLIK